MSSGRNYPRDYPGWAVEHHRSEKIIDTSNALYAIPQQVRRRRIRDGRQVFTAYDCNDLLAEGDSGRPGHLFD